MRKAILSQVRYLRYDFQNKLFLNILFIFVFIGVYFYFSMERSQFINRSNFEGMIIYNYMYLYIIARMTLSGISIPFEVLNTEYSTNNLLITQPIIACGVEWILFIRILLKVIKASVLNVFTFTIILSAGGFITDIKNYFVLIIPVSIGILFISCIGYFVSAFLFSFNIKRELISVVQAIVIVLFVGFSGQDNYLLPFTIINNKISGILMSDIVYFELGVEKTFSIWGYWLVVITLSVLLIFTISYFANIVFHKKEYRSQ